MKKSLIYLGLAGSVLLLIASCKKKQDYVFVGSKIDSQVMMVDSESNKKNAPIVEQIPEIEYAEGELVNPWVNEKISGDSNAKADNGDYDKPQEINIETFRHIQRFSVKEIGEGIEFANTEDSENPWITKITRDEKILFVSVPMDSNYNQAYKTVAKVENTRGVRIPGADGSPDLFEIIDDSNGNLKEVAIIPKGLPALKSNDEFKCFEFSEDEKYGVVGGQLYIFPDAETQKTQNMALVKFNTDEYSEPASYSAGTEQIAQRSELMLITKTAEKLTFDGKTSYWFQAKRGDKTFWVPGYNLYLQTGTFNRLNLTTEVVFVPLNGGNWYRITDDYPDPKGEIRAGKIVYVSDVSSGSYEKENRTSKIYRTSYPEQAEIFGIYLDNLDDLHGSFNFYPDNSTRSITYPAGNDPEVTIYEAPNARYKSIGKKYSDSTMPDDTESYTISVNGYTDMQDVVHDTFGRWYSVASPVKGFIFVEQPIE